MTLKQHNPGVHCNKNATNGIKLCLSFSSGLKFQAVYFKNAPASVGLRPPGPVCTAIKNDINSIKLRLSFSQGPKKFRLCIFKMLQLLGDSVPRLLPGLRPWTPLGDFHPQTPWFGPQLHILDPPLGTNVARSQWRRKCNRCLVSGIYWRSCCVKTDAHCERVVPYSVLATTRNQNSLNGVRSRFTYDVDVENSLNKLQTQQQHNKALFQTH